MDIELLKSTPDDQIEMMMMMHMNKSSASDFLGGGGSGGAYADGAPLMSFSSSEDGSPGGLSQHFNNLCNSSSPTSLHPQIRTISFSNTNHNSSSNNNNNNNMLLPSYGNNNGNESVPCYPPSSSTSPSKQTSMAAMREMIFRIAAMQPIYIDPEAVKPPKRRNVRISKDPQSVAARHRRERISERIRILQRLVPGGTKMDTASMLDEAIHYVKFLKTQVQSLERAAITNTNSRPIPTPVSSGLGFPLAVSSGNSGYFPMAARGTPSSQNLQQFISDA